MDLTRRYRFCASHRLHSEKLSAEANQEIYGKCNNPFGHGHNYELEVTVAGPVDPSTGRVVDVVWLDRLVDGHVVQAFDHRNLNEEFPVFQSLVPTTENLCVIIDRRLREAWPGTFPGDAPVLKRVSIWETARNIFVI